MPKLTPKHQPNVKPALLNDTPAKKNKIQIEKKTSTKIPIMSTIKNQIHQPEKKKEIHDEANMSILHCLKSQKCSHLQFGTPFFLNLDLFTIGYAKNNLHMAKKKSKCTV